MSDRRGCFHCGDQGHFARECTKNARSNENKCYNCGGVGHIARDCPSGQGGEITALNAINVVDSVIQPETVTNPKARNVIVATRKGTWPRSAQKGIEKLTWNAINAMKQDISQNNAQIERD